MRVLAIFAVFLAVTQASIPAIGQTSDKRTKNGQKQSAPTDTSNNPIPNIPPIVPKRDTSGANQSEPHQSPQTDNQSTIIVSAPAAMPVVWHWYEIVSWVAGLILVVVGISGVFIALGTLKKVERQTAATEKSLVLQFRPRLIVRSVVINRRSLTWTVRYTVSNIGGSNSRIGLLVSGVEFFENHYRPAEPPYQRLNEDRNEFVLEPGAHRTFVVELPTYIRDGFIKLPGDDILREIYFLGYMRFRDDNDLIRSMGFCRRYNPDTERFEVVDDPDYEYAD